MERVLDSPEARVLIVDYDHDFRTRLRAGLSRHPGITVVGDEAAGAPAIFAARSLRPDVVLLDSRLPDLDGIELTRTIVSAMPTIGIIMLTDDFGEGTVLAALRAGVRGYLLKEAKEGEIARAIAAARNGGAVFGAGPAEEVISLLALPPEKTDPFPGLTSRERSILEMLADGRNNLEIARELGLSHKTVRNYLSRIFAKVRVPGRAEAATLARRHGLGHRRAARLCSDGTVALPAPRRHR
jgi:DNA-binding NarL/FixJ family response regulator